MKPTDDLHVHPQILLAAQVVAHLYEHITVPEILSRNRNLPLPEARCFLVWLLRECTPLSYPEIARNLHRSHSTIHSLDARFQGLIQADRKLRNTALWVKKFLQEQCDVRTAAQRFPVDVFEKTG